MIDDLWVRATDDGVLVDVWVVPGASRTEIRGVHGGDLKVRVSQPPEGGRANAAVAGLLASLTGSHVELVRGHRSRRKTFALRDAELAAVRETLTR